MENCGECGGLGCKISRGDFFASASVCGCRKNCSECGGHGFTVKRGDDGYRYKNPCPECSAVYANINKYNHAQIPAAMAAAEVKPRNGSASARVAVNYIRRFISSYPAQKGFALVGVPGCGKSFLAAATVAELALKQGIDCLFRDFNSLISDIHRGREEGISEHSILEPLFKTEILAIDSVGFGGRELTGWEKSVLENIVSKRYGGRGKLIVTTSKHGCDNLGQRNLEKEMGDQGFSRLSRMCEFLTLD